MDTHFVLQTLASFFQGPVGAFIAFVVVDDSLGVALAIKNKTFDKDKLLSFVESQFATKAAMAIAVTALSVFITDGSGAAWAALVLACGKASLDVVKDVKVKLWSLAGFPIAASAG